MYDIGFTTALDSIFTVSIGFLAVGFLTTKFLHWCQGSPGVRLNLIEPNEGHTKVYAHGNVFNVHLHIHDNQNEEDELYEDDVESPENEEEDPQSRESDESNSGTEDDKSQSSLTESFGVVESW
jgi:hypothetical protein